jgi:enoyl-CoA hydratase
VKKHINPELRLRYVEDGRVVVISFLLWAETQDQMAQLKGELWECCLRFQANDRSIVLVIEAETPKTFSADKGLGEMRKEGAENLSVVQAIANLEKPVLIGIVGDAVGLGLELALACDIRVASDKSKFGLPQIRAGLMPWDGGTQRLARTVGKAKALEMLLTGEPIEAQEANRIGLVSRIVSADQVVPTVMKLAKDMASKSPISLEYCKEAITKGMDLTLEQGIRLEADLYFLMHMTHDREEGIKAFQEKREPEFEGN